MRKTQTIAKAGSKQPLEQAPRTTFVARRKRPWLLAVCGLLLLVWLAFLAYLAFRGS